jgi:putative nucleotidyltransferase with HDIG domain
MLRTLSVVPEPRRDALVDRIVENILRRISEGTVVLPSMPVAAFDCLELLRKPDFSVVEAARVIEEDLALAARVIEVTNSAAYNARQRAKTIAQAVMRLGAANLRSALFEAMAVPIYDSSDPAIRKACSAVWQHSRVVADFARRVATIAGRDDPGEAYLAGLLHDIGKPIVASLLLKAEHRLVGRETDAWLDPQAWLDIVQGAHRAAGVALARKWQLPEAVVLTAANTSTYDEGEPRSVPNCVRFANALAKEAGLYAGRSDPAHVAGVILTGQVVLGFGDAIVERLRADLRTSTRSRGAADRRHP